MLFGFNGGEPAAYEAFTNLYNFRKAIISDAVFAISRDRFSTAHQAHSESSRRSI
jgi:hypothetical protein